MSSSFSGILSTPSISGVTLRLALSSAVLSRTSRSEKTGGRRRAVASESVLTPVADLTAERTREWSVR